MTFLSRPGGSVPPAAGHNITAVAKSGQGRVGGILGVQTLYTLLYDTGRVSTQNVASGQIDLNLVP